MRSASNAVRNETIFAKANEAVERRRRSTADELLVFLCECSDLACRENIELTREEYVGVRQRRGRFALVPGHQSSDEALLDEFDRYAVVEKR